MTNKTDTRAALDGFDRMIRNGSWPNSIEPHLKTIRKALEQPKLSDDEVDGLKQKDDIEIPWHEVHKDSFDSGFLNGWNDCIDHLKQKGVL